MIGVYDFCGHYDWTFEWLRGAGGDALVRDYWAAAIAAEAQQHAARLIQSRGFDGMAAYWGHTLRHEGAGCHTARGEGVFRMDMHDCPSKGFLIRNGLGAYSDYCDHCMGWIGPLLKQAGFAIDHEHNHRGQCWWEIRRAADNTAPSEPGTLAGSNDVRLRSDWEAGKSQIDRYRHASQAADKNPA